MEDLHAALKELQTSIQLLLKKYNSLKKENENLRERNTAIMKQLSEKDVLINSEQEKRAANNATSGYTAQEKHLLQSKIDYYLRDIEKCLSLLNA